MGASQQALLMGGEVPVSDIIKSANAFPASNFTFGNANVDLLNGAGGSTISVSFTKGAGTSLLVSAGVTCRTSSASLGQLFANDGTTDNFVARNRVNTSDTLISGDCSITGLAAGTYTIKLRVRGSIGTFTFGVEDSAFLTVMEIP